MLFHLAVATPIQTFAGTEEGQMRRKRCIGEGVYYTWHESSIILKRELYVDNILCYVYQVKNNNLYIRTPFTHEHFLIKMFMGYRFVCGK